jgi:nitrite reductase/ring-hydroxylating ferredoxin subunit
MSEILAITAEQWAPFGFVLSRVIPLLEEGNAEHRETAKHLSFTLDAFRKTQPGLGEVELQSEDLYFLGLNLYVATADLEELWLDRLSLAKGGTAAEQPDPAVVEAARRYFPEVLRDPANWNYRSVQPAFLDLGMKIDALLTAQSPRSRGIYNKERSNAVRTQVERQQQNRTRRLVGGQPLAVALGLIGPGAGATAPAALSAPASERPPEKELVGTAVAPRRVAPAGLSVVSRASFPHPYGWGVEVGTGVLAGDLEPDKPRSVNVGGSELMLINTGGAVCAANRTCPHRQWDLTRGGKVENGVMTCALHGAQYNVCTGAVERQPYDRAFDNPLSSLSGAFDPKHTTEPLTTYPTRIADDGEVLVHI